VRPPVRRRFFAFDPLIFVAFTDYPHDLPTRKWLKQIPLFSGRLGESVRDHLAKFLQVVSDFNVEHENVVMRMFCIDPQVGSTSMVQVPFGCFH
jgi:hypothetical protein